MRDTQTVRLTDPNAHEFGFHFTVGDRVKSTLPKGLKGIVRDGWTDTHFMGGQGKVYLIRRDNGKYFSALEEHLVRLEPAESIEDQEVTELAGAEKQ
ncbi:MAG TPA: hypothetical protein VGK99_19870 [Acidobacteriota bacterium]|jgi:hypothetical protein